LVRVPLREFPLPRPDRKAFVTCSDNKCWIYPIGGGAHREIPGLSQRLLRWSPDGQKLAYVSVRDNHNLIAVYDVKSSGSDKKK
jgi:hypothetical protein